MKENSLARAGIRWAEGEEKNNLKSNCVMPHGSKGLQRDIFFFPHVVQRSPFPSH